MSNTREIKDNFFREIEMPGGWMFNHSETLKTIDLYLNSKFKSGTNDSRGFRKLFYNIVRPACDIATKFIDLDVANITLIPTRGTDEEKVWLLQRKLKQYLNDSGFAELLNEISEDYPKYGHVVIKKSNNKWSAVSLVNLRMDTTARTLEESPYVSELHVMSKSEMPKKWNTEVLKNCKEQFFNIFEEYDKTDTGWDRCIYANIKKDNKAIEAEINNQTDELEQYVLFEDSVKKLPYRELKWDEVKGRWLGMGFVEYLEDNQIATNEAENLERKGLFHKALQVWQTRDESIGNSNIFTDAENGDIIKVNQEITPVQKDNSDLAAFNSTRARWDKNSEQKTFSFDAARGDNLPSRTPLGVANLSVGMVASYFDFKREKYGIFIKRLLEEDVIPECLGSSNAEHVLMFSGSDDEIDRLDNLIVQAFTDEAVLKEAMKTGFFPSKDVREDLKERISKKIKSKKNRYLTIPEGFYKNAKYMVEIDITGESVNTSKQSEVYQMAMQTIATNPGILQNKTTRTIFFALLSGNGISPAKLNLLAENVDTTPVPNAGSLAGGSAPTQQMSQVTQTL